MFLTGYHGTTASAADSIISTNEFRPSTKDTEWLGDGIYFYREFVDAYNWRKDPDSPPSDTIIHAIIDVDDDAYLDLDSSEGHLLFKLISRYILAQLNASARPTKYAQKNQYAVAKMIWELSPELQVLSASLPSEHTGLPTMMDMRTKRKEFCVRDNCSIIYMNKIVKDEIDGRRK